MHTVAVDDFQVLVTSLGETAVAYIGRDQLTSLFVFGDPVDMAVDVEIGLQSRDWASMQHVTEKMLEIQEMFLNEVAVAYRFVDEDSDTVKAAVARHPAYALA